MLLLIFVAKCASADGFSSFDAGEHIWNHTEIGLWQDRRIRVWSGHQLMLFHQLCMRRIVYAYGQTEMLTPPWHRHLRH